MLERRKLVKDDEVEHEDRQDEVDNSNNGKKEDNDGILDGNSRREKDGMRDEDPQVRRLRRQNRNQIPLRMFVVTFFVLLLESRPCRLVFLGFLPNGNNRYRVKEILMLEALARLQDVQNKDTEDNNNMEDDNIEEEFLLDEEEQQDLVLQSRIRSRFHCLFLDQHEVNHTRDRWEEPEEVRNSLTQHVCVRVSPFYPNQTK
jgi:hypothetical protein